ncbi:hypothetical protein GW7_11200 [Heterocephalus glaber]|uniref:Uncharacterized protein n=1 Tax=Heterocephalus glaber TaxID=10181 RepID=G5AYM9_HETGA|nr:hypothetical protein GW7_11200 [Heterocephalus glaber]
MGVPWGLVLAVLLHGGLTASLGQPGDGEVMVRAFFAAGFHLSFWRLPRTVSTCPTKQAVVPHHARAIAAAGLPEDGPPVPGSSTMLNRPPSPALPQHLQAQDAGRETAGDRDDETNDKQDPKRFVCPQPVSLRRDNGNTEGDQSSFGDASLDLLLKAGPLDLTVIQMSAMCHLALSI